MGRKQIRQWYLRYGLTCCSQKCALENRPQVPATVRSVHEGVQKVAFRVPAVLILVAGAGRLDSGYLIVAGLMQITYGREYRTHQHGERQQQQRRKAQQAGIATGRGSKHGLFMLREPIAVAQLRACAPVLPPGD